MQRLGELTHVLQGESHATHWYPVGVKGALAFLVKPTAQVKHPKEETQVLQLDGQV